MSEMLFLGALFMAFSFSRALNPASFMEGARHTEIAFGAANTVVLVTSSLTMTLAVCATYRTDEARDDFLAVTVALGFLFLLFQGLEYRDDLQHHLFPGPHFALGQNAAQVFWAFYWAMTGIHAIHLAIGIAPCSASSGSYGVAGSGWRHRIRGRVAVLVSCGRILARSVSVLYVAARG